MKTSTTDSLTLLISKPTQVTVLQCYYKKQHNWLLNTVSFKTNTSEYLTLLTSKQAQLKV